MCLLLVGMMCGWWRNDCEGVGVVISIVCVVCVVVWLYRVIYTCVYDLQLMLCVTRLISEIALNDVEVHRCIHLVIIVL